MHWVHRVPKSKIAQLRLLCGVQSRGCERPGWLSNILYEVALGPEAEGAAVGVEPPRSTGFERASEGQYHQDSCLNSTAGDSEVGVNGVDYPAY